MHSMCSAAHGIEVPEELISCARNARHRAVEPNRKPFRSRSMISLDRETSRYPVRTEIDGRLGDWIEEIRGAPRGQSRVYAGHSPRSGTARGELRMVSAHAFLRASGASISVSNASAGEALAVAKWTDPAADRCPGSDVRRVTATRLRAGFPHLLLHEQFHHKVESLGFPDARYVLSGSLPTACLMFTDRPIGLGIVWRRASLTPIAICASVKVGIAANSVHLSGRR